MKPDATDKVREIYKEFLAAIQKKFYSEDDLFDLEVDLADAIIDIEFPELTFKSNLVDEALKSAVDDYIGGISKRIRRRQSDARTEKMVLATIKRGRRILNRIKPKEGKEYENTITLPSN